MVPAELTMRRVQLAPLHARVLGVASGIHLTFINYTKDSVGFHFDPLHIWGDDPFIQEFEAPPLTIRHECANLVGHATLARKLSDFELQLW